MDSEERDERKKKGFGERGERLYNPEEQKNKLRKSDKYNSSGKEKKDSFKDNYVKKGRDS